VLSIVVCYHRPQSSTLAKVIHTISCRRSLHLHWNMQGLLQ